MKKMKKILSITLTVTTVCWLAGVAVFAPVSAATILEGDIVSPDATYTDDDGNDYFTYDVFIIKYMGDKKFKRLVLNPQVFESYGHLKWGNIKTVTVDELKAFASADAVRADGDEKVYKLFPDGDTGIKRWVETLDCFNSKNYDWDSVYIINSVDRDNYTTGAGMCGGVVEGDVTASLTADNPISTTLTTNAQGVEFLKVNFSGTGTLNSVTIKRLGAGAVGDFDNVYLYEGARRLVTGKSLSSSTGEATFSNLKLEISGSRTLVVVGDLSATPGNVNYFTMKSAALSSGTVVAGLALTGNPMAVSGASSGDITITKIGSLGNPNAGQANAELSQFKIAVATEAASIKRIQLIQGGTVKPADTTNLKLKTGTESWDGTINKAGYAVFDLGSGYTITKGANAIFRIFADLAGKKDETVEFYFEYSTDVLAIGDQYGFGMAATITDMDVSTDSHQLTLQGGVLTVTFNGPTAVDVGIDTDDTVFLKFTISAASDIEIRKTRLMLSLDLDGNDTWDAIAGTSLSSGFSDLDDIKIYDEDTGAVLCGPVDGSVFKTSVSDGNPSASATASYVYTDAIDMSAGQTIHAKVTADIKTANTRTGTDIETDSKITISLQDYSDNVGVTELRYTGTNTSLGTADIVPNAHIHGATLTVVGSALSLGLASNPADQTVVKGSSNFDVVGITFRATNASDLQVTDITLSGYSCNTAGGAYTLGSAGNIGSIVALVALYEKETGALISNTPAANNLAAAAGTVVFNNLDWTIPAGGTKTLLVRVNILNLNAPTKDYFSFDIVVVGDVTALDNSNNTVNPGNATPNGATSITTNGQMVDSGHIFVTEDESSPSKQKNALYWGQEGIEVSHFKVRTTNEAFFIDRFNIVASSSGGADANAKANVMNVYLKYQDKDGAWITSNKQPLSNDTVPSTSFGFSGDARPYIPKDSSRIIKVLVDTVGTYATGATSGVASAISFSGANADEFSATGEGSLTKIKGADTTGDDTDAITATNLVYFYRSFPKFAAISLPDGATKGQAVIGKFTITAMGDDVMFGATANASGSLIFDTLSSGSGSPTYIATLYDDTTNQILDTVSVAGAKNASVSFETFTNAFNIPAGETKTIRIEANLSEYTTPVATNPACGADHYQLILQDHADKIMWVDFSGADMNNDMANIAGYIETVPAYGPYLTGQ